MKIEEIIELLTDLNERIWEDHSLEKEGVHLSFLHRGYYSAVMFGEEVIWDEENDHASTKEELEKHITVWFDNKADEIIKIHGLLYHG